MSLKVAVVEDDALMRLAIIASLKMAGMELAFQAGSAAQAVDLVSKHLADAAVLDLHLGDGPTGIDVAREFRRRHPNIGIVFLTSFEDPRLLGSALPEIPAHSEYLVKGDIQDVKTISQAISNSVSARANATTSTSDSVLRKLTDNQMEILRLVGEGKSNAEIAKLRFVTEKSVEVSISRIAKALGVTFDAKTNQRVHIAKVYFRAIGKSLE